jgi:nitrate reductase gamma subunit
MRVKQARRARAYLGTAHRGNSMDLLDWARGPLLVIAIAVFVAGCAWRAWSLLRLPQRAPSARERRAFGRKDAARAALRRFAVPRGFSPSATLVTFNPYLFHIGLALVFFGYAPHIAFVRRLTGLSWPALPDAVMYVAAGLTIASLLLAMLFRLSDPVLRRISRADDHLSWTLTVLPLLTGMAVVGEPSSALLGQVTAYRDPLAVHLLAVELLMVWFPFGKLMHAFLALPARMQLATFFGRRGVRA